MGQIIKQMTASQKREKIIAASMAVFAEKGFAKTSMADIANKAGIGKGTTYEYFKSKDDLFFETFKWFLEYSEQSANLSLSTLAAKSAQEKIQAFSQCVLLSLKQAEPFYPLTFEFWAASSSSKYKDEIKKLFKDFYRRVGTIFTAIIEQGVEQGEFDRKLDIHSFVPVIVGAWDMIGVQAWFDHEFDIEKAMNAFTDLIIKGLSKK